MLSEHEDVEVDLARSPSCAPLTPERTLDVLEVHEELEGRRFWFIRAGRRVEGDHRVSEVGLVRDTHRPRRVQAGHAAKADVGKIRHGAHSRGQRSVGVAEVRPEADVGADGPGQRPSLLSIDSVP